MRTRLLIAGALSPNLAVLIYPLYVEAVIATISALGLYRLYLINKPKFWPHVGHCADAPDHEVFVAVDKHSRYKWPSYAAHEDPAYTKSKLKSLLWIDSFSAADVNAEERLVVAVARAKVLADKFNGAMQPEVESLISAGRKLLK